jgi:hypothetical protein
MKLSSLLDLLLSLKIKSKTILMTRNVIVFGATGKTGNYICKELEANNITYSVFVREASIEKITSKVAKVKQGDVFNATDVEQAFINENYTDVIIALGSKVLKNAEIRTKGTQHIIDAMTKRQSQAYLHVISALGVGNSWKQLSWVGKLISNLLLKSVMIDHAKQEELVMNSSSSYHILRPVGLKDGASKGLVYVENEKKLPSSSIQMIDVAKYLVESLMAGKTGVSGISQKK